MARILSDNNSVVLIWVRFVVLGIALGIFYFLLAAMLDKYVVSPAACSGGDPTRCVNSFAISSGISSVLTAVAGLFASIRFQAPRPLLLMIAVTVLTFGLGTWTSGMFWLEALGWSGLVYMLAFVLFTGIFQFRSLVASMIVTVVILVAGRIALTL